MPESRREITEPLEANEVFVSWLGAIAFAIALVVLLIVPLDDDDQWWRWVCLTGMGGGLFSVWYIPHLKRKRAEAEARREATDQQDPD